MTDSDIELDYDTMTFNALRQVVRDVLTITQELGETPGDHHFYMEFQTRGEGVIIPDFLLETYPERMTIVLQNQFDGLEVTNEAFSVTLWFKGKPARLTIPFQALTNFADPSVSFGLHFEGEIARPRPPAEDSEDDAAEEAADEGEAAKDAESGAEVVSLDKFRKK